MRAQRCTECGADLRLEASPCPLCGAEPREHTQEEQTVTDVESYQSSVRRLRAQLRRLRDDAEAV
jgi:hypothetical protein